MARLADPKGPEQAAPVSQAVERGTPEGPQPQDGSQKEVGFISPGATGPRTPPDPQKDPYGYLIFIMEEGFGSVHQRLDQQGKVVADLAERVFGPQTASAGQAEPPAKKGLDGIINSDTINKFLDLAKSQLTQVDPRDQRALEIGYKILNGAEDTALKSVYRGIGKEVARDVTHIG